MNNTHNNTIAKAKRLVASVLLVTLCLQDATPAFAITFDSAASDYFDTVDDFGLSAGSDNISVRFGTTLGEFLRFNRSADKFILSNDLDVRGTLSGSALTIMGGVSYLLGNVGIGSSATPQAKLEVVGTISGSSLKVTGTAAISGALVLEAGSTLSGSALQGFGLTDCDTAGTSKLMWDSTTGRFSCGTDQTGGSSGGLSLSDADKRYVNTAGDTMTGQLVVRSTGSFLGSASNTDDVVLTVRGASGQSGNLQEWKDGSGNPVAWITPSGSMDSSYLNVSSAGNINTLHTSYLYVNTSASLGDDTGDTISFGGLIGSELTANSGGAYNVGSDTYRWNIGYFTGLNVSQDIYASGNITGYNLTTTAVPSCSGVLQTDMYGTIYCGSSSSSADDWGNGFFNISDGTTTESIYAYDNVNFSHDSFIGLNVTATDTVYIYSNNSYANDMNQNVGTDDSVTFSEIHTNGTSYFGDDPSDNIAFVGTVGTDFVPQINNSFNIGASGTLWNTGWFNDLQTNTLNVSSNASIGGVLTLGSMDGNVYNSVTPYGSLTFDLGSVTNKWRKAYLGSANVYGVLSGVTLYATKSFSGAGLTDCDNSTTSKLLWDATTGRFSCGTDQSGGSSGGTYTAGQGLALNGTSFSLGQTISGTLLEFQTVSGSTVYGSKALRSSGTLVTESGAFINGNILFPNAAGTNRTIGTQYVSGQLGDSLTVSTASGTTIAGSLRLFGGGGIGTGDGGDVTIGAGRSFDNPGDVRIFGGASTDTTGGNVFVYGGDGDSVDGDVILGHNGTSAFGNVGVGANTAKAKLAVTGTISGSSITQNGNTNNSFMGNVGVGTTTPGANLHIAGGVGTNARVEEVANAGRATLSLYTASGSMANKAAIRNARVFGSIEGSGYNGTDYVNSASIFFSASQMFNPGSSPSDIRFFNTATGSTTLSERMRIAYTGNVGIGSTAPKAHLDVVGTVSGVTVYATRSFSGAGLTDCDTAGTSKLLWDATTGRFSCGTDQTGGGTGGTSLSGTLLTVNGSGTIRNTDPNDVALVVRAAPSQSFNLQEWRDSNNNQMAYVSPTGNIGTNNSMFVGGDSADYLYIAADVNSSFNADSNNSYNIGNSSNRWNTGWFVNLNVANQIDATNVTATSNVNAANLNATNNLSISGTSYIGSDNADNIYFGGDVNSSFNPDANNSYSIGNSSNRWNTGWFVHGNFAGDFNVGGNVALGDSNADNIAFNGDLNTSFNPNVNNTYDIGNSSFRWGAVWANSMNLSAGISALGTASITGNVGIGSGNSTTKAVLAVTGTISGATVYATKSFSGAGLTDCDNSTTSKLLWDATTGRFSCGTDQSGGGSTGGGGSTLSGKTLYLTGTGAANSPLFATNLSYGTILMGTGSMKAGSGKFMPQLFVAGRLPVLIGSGATANVPRGIAVQGDFAYVSTQSSMQVFNVAIPGSPKAIGSVVSSTAFGIAAQGEYVYTAHGGGVTIINVANPTLPVNVGTYTDSSCVTGLGARDVTVQGRYAYVSCYSASLVQVLDVSDPSEPKLVGSAGSANPYELHVQGNYVYVATSTGFQVIDVSDPTKPFQAGAVAAGSTPQGVYVQGRYAYVSNYGGNSVTIFDLSNPTSPVATSTWSTGTSSGPQNVVVEGRFMYVTNYDGNAFQTVDVSNPNAPYLIGNVPFPVTSSPHSIAIQGRYAFVTLANRAKLQVLDLGGAYVQQLEAGGAKFGSLAISNKLSGMDAVFRGGMWANSLHVENGVSVNGGSGAYALKVNTGGILLNGGSLSGIPSFAPKTMSGVEVGANVNNVFVTGNYLYTVSDAVSGNEFRVTDVGNPSAPVSVGGFETGQNTKALFVSTRHAFVGMNGSGAGSGMYIMDVSNPGTPKVVSRLNFGTAVNQIYVSGKYAYVGLNGMTSGTCAAKYQLFTGCDFAVVDFTDALRPRVIGGLQFGVNVNALYIQNRYAYVGTDATAGEFKIIDLMNPLDPVQVGSIDYGTAPVSSVYASGRYAYVGTSSAFYAYDVSNKASPSLLGSVTVGVAVNSISVTGDWARIGSNSLTGNELQTIDLRVPTTPAVVGGLDIGAKVNGIAVSGKYAYVVNDSMSGFELRSLDLGGVEAAGAMFGSALLGNLFVSDNVRFDNNAYVRNALNVGRGGIISKGALSVQTTGTGSAKGGTGALMNAFDVRNGTGQHLFSVSENGVVQGGIPAFATGTTMLAYNMMSRRSGNCFPLTTAATTYTSVGMSTCTVNGVAVAWAGGNRMRLKLAATNTASAMGGITTTFTETKATYRPKMMFDIMTGTGTTGLRFWGGTLESSLAALPLVSPNTTGTSAIDFAALGWEDGVNGTQWMCCSGNGTNYSCNSMGVPVTANTEYIGTVDWSTAGMVSCTLQAGAKTYRNVKTTHVSIQSVALGITTVIVNKAIASATARVVYIAKVYLEQN